MLIKQTLRYNIKKMTILSRSDQIASAIVPRPCSKIYQMSDVFISGSLRKPLIGSGNREGSAGYAERQGCTPSLHLYLLSLECVERLRNTAHTVFKAHKL